MRPSEEIKDHLIRLVRHKLDLGPQGATEIVDAIEALIHDKLAEAMNLMSDKIQEATGVRP